MLICTQFSGFCAGKEPSAVTLAYAATSAEGSGWSTSHTFSGVGIGTAATDRKVLVGVVGQIDGATTTISGVTVGGISATQLVSARSGNANNHVAEFWIASVPTGTTADIVVTASGTWFRSAVATWEATCSSTAYDTDAVGELSNVAISGSVNIASNGAAVAIVTNNGASEYSWTNLTERVDTTTNYGGNQYSAASDTFASGESARAITATQNVNNAPHVLAIVSLIGE